MAEKGHVQHGLLMESFWRLEDGLFRYWMSPPIGLSVLIQTARSFSIWHGLLIASAFSQPVWTAFRSGMLGVVRVCLASLGQRTPMLRELSWMQAGRLITNTSQSPERRTVCMCLMRQMEIPCLSTLKRHNK